MGHDFPDIRRGTRFNQIPARAWQNVRTIAEAISQITVGPGLRIARRGRHVSIRLAPIQQQPGAAPATTQLIGLERFILAYPPWYIDAPDDCLICRHWDTTLEEYEPILVAKPRRLQKTPYDGRQLGGLLFEYNPGDSTQRTVHGPRGSEKQVIVPGWRAVLDAWDFIVAGKPVGGTGVPERFGVPIVWQDLNVDGRAWARRHRQHEPA